MDILGGDEQEDSVEQRGLLRDVEQCVVSAEDIIHVAATGTSDDGESSQSSSLQHTTEAQPGPWPNKTSQWTSKLPIRSGSPVNSGHFDGRMDGAPSDDSEDESIGDPEPDLEVGLPAEVYTTLIANLLQELQKDMDARDYHHAERTYKIVVKHYNDRETHLGIKFDERSELSEKLVEIYLNQQRYQKAKHLLNQLLQDKSLDMSRRWTLYLALADAYCGQNRLDKALLYAQRSLRGRERLFGQSSQVTHEAATVVMDIYERQGEVETANVLREIYCPNTLPTPPPKSALRSMSQRTTSNSPQPSMPQPEIESQPPPVYQEEVVNHKVNRVRWAPDVWHNDFGINAILESGKTSLIEAISKRNEEEINLLLSQGANVETTCAEMMSPLMHAVTLRAPDIVSTLLEHGASVDVSLSGWTPLHKAVDLGDVASMRLLLSHGADIEFKSPLEFVNAQSAKARIRAIASGEPNVESDNVSVSDRGWTPLHRASRKDNEAVVRFLLDHGADIEAQTPEKFTPLMCACENLHPAIVDLLLMREANIHACDAAGWRPIHRALVNRCPEPLNPVLPLLLDHEADINARCNFGKAPLHYAVEKNDATTVSYLLSKDADIEARDLADCTPLHTAIECRLEPMVRLLLDQSADATAMNGAEQDALAAANHTERKSPEIIALLKRHKERLKRENSAAAGRGGAKKPSYGERRRGSLAGVRMGSVSSHSDVGEKKKGEKGSWFGSRSGKRK